MHCLIVLIPIIFMVMNFFFIFLVLTKLKRVFRKKFKIKLVADLHGITSNFNLLEIFWIVLNSGLINLDSEHFVQIMITFEQNFYR